MITFFIAAALTASSLETYKNDKSGYSFDYPVSWMVNQKLNPFDVVIYHDQDANFSVISGPLPEDITLDIYTSENLKGLERNKSIKDLKKETIEINGKPAIKIQYLKEDDNAIITHYFLILDHTAYLITTGAKSSENDKYLDTFKQMIESFHFNQDKKPPID